MQVEHLDSHPLTQAEQEDLAKLENLLKQAIADGQVTAYELKQINAVIHADGQVLCQELELVQKFICEKLQHGEVGFSRFSNKDD